MTNAVRLTVQGVARHIAMARCSLTRETTTHVELDGYLRRVLAPGVLIEREVRLSPADRPDFVIDGRIVVEVKLKRPGNRPETVLRQLGRYAEHDGVEAIILASNLAMTVPAALNGKPVLFVSLGRAWL
ncbi:MAG TPA: hypothetical protein VL358_04665 [Caulobacteraceae bacterium]|jgi:hypothetical protein|nr:hypothetical protein [Caulobacteraceae bacterium]